MVRAVADGADAQEAKSGGGEVAEDGAVAARENEEVPAVKGKIEVRWSVPWGADVVDVRGGVGEGEKADLGESGSETVAALWGGKESVKVADTEVVIEIGGLPSGFSWAP